MMNFLIKLVGAAISRRIESGSSKGAWVGGVVGAALLGGAGGWGWYTGATGFIGGGFMLVGVLFGGIVGAVIGAGLGPEDRLIHAEGQTSVRLTDYNRKLVALLPMVICAVVAALAVMLIMKDAADPKLKPDDLGALKIAAGVCALVSLGCAVYLPMPVISLTLGDRLRVNKLLSHRAYDYAEVQDWGFTSRSPAGAPINPKAMYAFYMKLPDRRVEIPVNGRKLVELRALLEGLVSQAS